MNKIIIFGIGTVAKAFYKYLKNDNEFKISAFTCDQKFINSHSLNEIPIIDSNELITHFSPEEYQLVIAIGYHELGASRFQVYERFKKMGYKFLSYCKDECEIGANSLVLPGATIQPGVRIGNNVVIWGNALIGHDCIIDDNTWITGGAAIGGNTSINKFCFIGLNSTIGPNITIGEYSIIGAHTLTTKNVPPNSVIVSQDTPKHRLSSKDFIKLSKSFI